MCWWAFPSVPAHTEDSVRLWDWITKDFVHIVAVQASQRHSHVKQPEHCAHVWLLNVCRPIAVSGWGTTDSLDKDTWLLSVHRATNSCSTCLFLLLLFSSFCTFLIWLFRYFFLNLHVGLKQKSCIFCICRKRNSVFIILQVFSPGLQCNIYTLTRSSISFKHSSLVHKYVGWMTDVGLLLLLILSSLILH